MKTFDIVEFICELQELTPLEAIEEIGTAGLTNDEIAYCVKQIATNHTFVFKKTR